jgi:hypothetical protein
MRGGRGQKERPRCPARATDVKCAPAAGRLRRIGRSSSANHPVVRVRRKPRETSGVIPKLSFDEPASYAARAPTA